MNVAEAIGTYGAILSTLVAYRQWRASRPKIVINAMPAFNGPDHKPVGNFVRVVVANHGGATIHIRQAFVVLLMDWGTWRTRITAFFLRWGRWRSNEQLSMPLPDGTLILPALTASLQPGQSTVIWIKQSDYQRLRYGPRVTGIQIGIQDETDRTFVGRPMRHIGLAALPDNGVPREI